MEPFELPWIHPVLFFNHNHMHNNSVSKKVNKQVHYKIRSFQLE